MFTSRSIGWVRLEALQAQKKDFDLRLMKGSPRELMSSAEISHPKTATEIRFSLQSTVGFLEVSKLVPDSLIVASTDTLPGVPTHFLPNTPSDTEIKLVANTQIYITHVRIMMKEAVETEIITQIQNYLKVTGYNPKALKIKDRQIIAGFHNGWTCINSKGLSNRQSLKPMQNDKLGNRVYEYSGLFEIDTIFAHEISALILQLEYEVEITTEQGKSTQTKCPGWLPGK